MSAGTPALSSSRGGVGAGKWAAPLSGELSMGFAKMTEPVPRMCTEFAHAISPKT